MTTKININSFALTALLAKLVVIQREYDSKTDELLADRAAFDRWIEQTVKANFEFEVSAYKAICSHLSLFLLGNPDNKFSNLIHAA